MATAAGRAHPALRPHRGSPETPLLSAPALPHAIPEIPSAIPGPLHPLSARYRRARCPCPLRPVLPEWNIPVTQQQPQHFRPDTSACVTSVHGRRQAPPPRGRDQARWVGKLRPHGGVAGVRLSPPMAAGGGAGLPLPPHSPWVPGMQPVGMQPGGEPLRIVPRLEAAEEAAARGLSLLSLLSLRREVAARLGHVRRALVHEPGGHSGTDGAVVVGGGAAAAGAHLAAIFLHGSGCSSMCGRAVRALGRSALHYGLVAAPSSPETPARLRCPCGPLAAFVPWDGRRSGNPVPFHSLPAIAAATDLAIDVPGHGKVVVDIGYGGTFYAFLSAEQLGLDVCSSKTKDLVNAAMLPFSISTQLLV
ncbi:LOW QUALITY PROTEIN: trans-3-hydroxy-L-proline dehydratase [Phaethornis superciliosus]